MQTAAERPRTIARYGKSRSLRLKRQGMVLTVHEMGGDGTTTCGFTPEYKTGAWRPAGDAEVDCAACLRVMKRRSYNRTAFTPHRSALGA